MFVSLSIIIHRYEPNGYHSLSPTRAFHESCAAFDGWQSSRKQEDTEIFVL